MKLYFVGLVATLIFSSTAVLASSKCGDFQFTNNLHEPLYIQISDSSKAFCGLPVPKKVLPRQTVYLPISETILGCRVNITTDPSQYPIHADYDLLLQYTYSDIFNLAHYDFHDEINTGPFSWSFDRNHLSFCTEEQFNQESGDCSYIK